MRPQGRHVWAAPELVAVLAILYDAFSNTQRLSAVGNTSHVGIHGQHIAACDHTVDSWLQVRDHGKLLPVRDFARSQLQTI